MWLPEKWFLGTWVWKPFKLPPQKESSLQEKSWKLQEKECSDFFELSSQDPKSEAAFNNLGFIFPEFISSFYMLALVPLQKNLMKIQLHKSWLVKCWNPQMTPAAERQNQYFLDIPNHKWASDSYP